VTTTRSQPPRMPATAQRIRLALWQRSKTRARQRYGFDIEAGDALDRARALVAGDPGNAELHLLLASVLATRGEPALAESEARQALDLAPRLARARTTLATLLVQRGEKDEGLREARNAAALDMEDPTILFNLGLAEWVNGERKTARAAFSRAAEILDKENRPAGADERPRWWRRIRRRG